MRVSHWLRLSVLATIFTALGFLVVGSPPAPNESQSDSGPAQTPKQILIIRHAEKPDDDADTHLTSRGAARAAALPSLFLIPPTFPTKPAPFDTPDFIFATKESKHSNRPVETVTPLAKALGDMPIQQKDSNDEHAKVVERIFAKDKYVGKTILICWHHGTIPELTLAIAGRAKNSGVAKNAVPKSWPGMVFDRVWVFTFDASGTATFINQPQRLLFGDSKK